jgi:hypothetical protein
MKKFVLFSLMVFYCFRLLAQTTVYDPNAELRSARNFTAIDVSDGVDIYVSNGDEGVAVSASEIKYRDKIKVVVDKGVLKISSDESNKFSVNGKRNLRAYISYKNLNALSASGGSDVIMEGSVKGKEFFINISGGSDFKGKVDVTELRINQSGGSDVSISGSAKTVSINTSGGSDFNGYGLNADVCDVEASGGSDVEITVNKEISARASGASDVSFKGTAAIKQSKSSGASSVSKRS